MKRNAVARVEANEYKEWKAQEAKKRTLAMLDEELAERAQRRVSRASQPQFVWAYAHIEFARVRQFENEFLSRVSMSGWALVACTPTAYVLRNRVGGR